MCMCASLRPREGFGIVRLFVDVGLLRVFYSRCACKSGFQVSTMSWDRRIAFDRENYSAAVALRFAVVGLLFWRDSKICPQCKCEPRERQVS
jgi:hypothetical protein